MVGLDRAVARQHGRPLDDRQQVALHPLLGDVRPPVAPLGDQLVDLVDDDDAAALGPPDRLLDHAVEVDQPVGLLIGQDAAGVGDRDPPRATARAAKQIEQFLPALPQLVGVEVGEEIAEGRVAVVADDDLNLDRLVLQLALPQLRQQPLAPALQPPRLGGADRLRRLGRAPGAPRHPAAGGDAVALVRRVVLAQEVGGQPLGRGALGLVADLRQPLLVELADADLDEVADDRLDIAPDVADLGELGRLDLEEGGAGDPGDPAGDLGLADAGRPDHQDVLGADLVAQGLRQALAAQPPAQGDGDGALGLALPDDEAVEFGDDRRRGEIVGRGPWAVGRRTIGCHLLPASPLSARRLPPSAFRPRPPPLAPWPSPFISSTAAASTSPVAVSVGPSSPALTASISRASLV